MLMFFFSSALVILVVPPIHGEPSASLARCALCRADLHGCSDSKRYGSGELQGFFQ